MRSLGGRGARVLLAGGMLGAGALSASVAGAYASTAASHKAAAHKPAALKGTITVFSQGDFNVQNLWSNTLIPLY